MTFGRCGRAPVEYLLGMHIRRGFLGWGVFLILAGAIPLAVRAGYLDSDQIGRLWTLWPMILIGVGVGLILSRTRFGFLGGLIVAATLGLMVGGLLASGISTFSSGVCGQAAGTTAFPSREGTFSAAVASVDLELDCGNVTVAVAPGDTWRYEGQDANGVGPEDESTPSTLKIRTREDGDDGPSWFLGARETWQVTLPTTPRLGIDLHLNAGQATVDLAGATLGTVKLQLNAGAATVDLGSAASIDDLVFQLNAGSLGLTLPNVSVTGSVEANAGAVRLCAPPGAGLRLRTGDSIIASYDYAGHGLVQNGTTWTTPGYEGASVQIDLRTAANAGSFTLDPEGGCD